MLNKLTPFLDNEQVWKQLLIFRSDVWSFGILMFEVLSIGEMPYRSVKMADYKKRLKTEWE